MGHSARRHMPMAPSDPSSTTHQQFGGFGAAKGGLGVEESGLWTPSKPAAGLFDGLGGDASGDEGSSDDESYGGGFGGSASSARYFERAGVAEDEDEGGYEMYS